MIDFGVGRVATHHYMLLSAHRHHHSDEPQKIRKSSKENQATIRQYSGEWLAARIVEGYAPYNKRNRGTTEIRSGARGGHPQQADIRRSRNAFKAARTEWAELSPHNRQLLNAAEAELRQLRSTQ